MKPTRTPNVLPMNLQPFLHEIERRMTARGIRRLSRETGIPASTLSLRRRLSLSITLAELLRIAEAVSLRVEFYADPVDSAKTPR